MKLFNHQRRKLLKKYTLYALGEVILVVIGILIAVSINSINEGNKAEAKRQRLAKRVYNQMILDSLDVHKVLQAQERTNILYDKILRETKPDEPITNCSGCTSLIIANFSITNMDTKVSVLLEDAELVEDSLSQVLREIEADYKDTKIIFDLLEESILDNLKANVQYLRDTYPWFASFMAAQNCAEGCQEYFSLSTDYRNRVAYQELLTRRAYTSELTDFIQELRDYLAELDSMINLDIGED